MSPLRPLDWLELLHLELLGLLVDVDVKSYRDNPDEWRAVRSMLAKRLAERERPPS